MPIEGLTRANLRPSRDLLTRNHLKRPETFRPAGKMVDINPQILGEDITVRWVRKWITKTEEDQTSLFKRMSVGWIPVKAEEIPSLEMLRDPDGHIASNGCILCKIPSIEARYQKEYCEERALGQLEGAAGDFLREDAGGRIPKQVLADSKKSFRGKLPS
jgi:hypothetical protein